jgi:poly(hydroxyalkanoate) depolymerase family esterase
MKTIDWRALYASNRAVIERAGGRPGDLPVALRAPVHAPSPFGTGRARRRRGAPWGVPGGQDLVHAPAGTAADVAVPLVCMLHGCTQDPAAIAAATRLNEAADRHGFAVVYPGQHARSNAHRCWNWFLPEHQQRDAGEPARIAEAVRRLVDGSAAGLRIDAHRVFVAGFSAGGAMAAVLAFTHPDLFAAAAVHSGLAYGAAGALGAAYAAMAHGSEEPAPMPRRARPVPTIVVHGTADSTVAPVNADHVLRQSMAANRLASADCAELDPARPSEASRGRVDGGHAYTRRRWRSGSGALMHELLTVHGLGHAWSGGAAGGSHTDPRGPSATAAIWRFFAAVSAGVPAS